MISVTKASNLFRNTDGICKKPKEATPDFMWVPTTNFKAKATT